VHVRVENTGAVALQLNLADFELNDQAGATYKLGNESIHYSEWNKLARADSEFAPKMAAEVGLIFDVGPEAKGFRLALIKESRQVDLGR
jgi:hypothetical protein